ncbi:MAG: hypothetical protein KF883_08260 [Thermomicrobiales bacterium]|nr:hypothetical protein [Thermomicrobiales bacterium]
MSDSVLRDLIASYAQGASPAPLVDYLIAESRLPGPRANLEIGAAFATDVGALLPVDRAVVLLEGLWIAADEADTNDPRSFPVFAAAQAAGVCLAQADGDDRGRLLMMLRRAANDPRWRVREGAAMGLQRVGDTSFDGMIDIARSWGEEASLLELRAIVAAIAEPRLLNNPDAVAKGWPFIDLAMRRLAATPKEERRLDEFKALRKGLGYAISVLTAADPAGGFPRLAEWANSDDRDVVRVVRENLKKKRLLTHHPKETAAVEALMT